MTDGSIEHSTSLTAISRVKTVQQGKDCSPRQQQVDRPVADQYKAVDQVDMCTTCCSTMLVSTMR